jgi:hypothetical protein
VAAGRRVSNGRSQRADDDGRGTLTGAPHPC